MASEYAELRKRIDAMQKLYQDMVFCVNNIDPKTGQLSQFLTDVELQRVYRECVSTPDFIYIEDKKKLNKNWSLLQTRFSLYEEKRN